MPQVEITALSPRGHGRGRGTRVPSRMGLVARDEGCRAGWLPLPASPRAWPAPSLTQRGKGMWERGQDGEAVPCACPWPEVLLEARAQSGWVSGVFSGSQGRNCRERQTQGARCRWQPPPPRTQSEGEASRGIAPEAHRGGGTGSSPAWRRGSDR